MTKIESSQIHQPRQFLAANETAKIAEIGGGITQKFIHFGKVKHLIKK